MKTVWLYAGQGSQHEGMGTDIYEAFPEYREVIDSLQLSFDVKAMMQNAKLDVLSQTQNTQPCMAAFAAGVTKVLKSHNVPMDGACGLSLGEYGALHAAGAFDAETYVKLTEFRGREMALAAEGKECSMSAVMGMDVKLIEKACEDCQDVGFVKLVNYNCPGQYVICGDEAAVAAVEAHVKDQGAKRCIRLKVSGPFHTKYMKPAAIKLGRYLEQVSFDAFQKPVALNVTGDFYQPEENLKALLEQQIQDSVHFESDVMRFLDEGADTFIEIGPGSILSGFVKKIAKAAGKEVTTYKIDTAADLEQLIAEKGE
ncbi:MAG: ACP S-malonyltransferase [Lachnospiraceae bacterium]